MNETVSSVQNIAIGVPQGSILVPLLFLVYINDLANIASSIDFVLFADDTNLFSTANNGLQQQLPLVEQWSSANKLVLNGSKTFHVIFKDKNK